jgi:uncharacterized protein (TIGR02757 family)
MNTRELKDFLEEKYDQYNRNTFIQPDPISIPHQFKKKEDIEIAGFLAATIAWGQRPTIIRNAQKLVEWMDMSPYAFIMGAKEKDMAPFKSFVHRTFNGTDCVYFIRALANIYKKHEGLEHVFSRSVSKADKDLKNAIIHFRETFFELPHPSRTTKHISNPADNSAAKRINMYLRWMVRKDKRNIDFGIWKTIRPSQLSCPLDVHSGNVGRKLGLLKRKQNDWKAVEELTNNLKKFDPDDPVKYDFALFGLGVFEGF